MPEVQIVLRTIDESSKTNQKVKENFQALVPGIEKARSSITGFVSANAGLIAGIVGVGVALRGAFNDFQKYAGEVRDLSLVSGTTAEESSRLLQVLDDYQVTAADVTTATRAMKEKGLVPTIDTLAKLSDQFLAIKDPAERLKFAQDNLGRSASAYYNVLSKGSKVILDNAAAVDKSLILTDEQIRKSEQQRLALDELSDAWQGLKIQVGAAVGELVMQGSQSARAFDILKENGVTITALTTTTQEYKDALAQAKQEQEDQAAAMSGAADAAGEYGTALEETIDPAKEAAEVAKALSDVYQGLLDVTFDIAGQNRDYADSLDELAKSDQELEDKKKRLTYEWYQEQAAGNATTQSYNDYIAKLSEVDKAITDNQAKREELAADQKRQNDERLYQMVQERLAADGIVNSGEFEFLQNLAVTKGLVTRADADQAIQAAKTADAMVASFEQQTGAMMTTKAAMDAIYSYDGKIVQFGVNFQTTGALPGMAPPPGPTPNRGSGNVFHGRDAGGGGMSGSSYWIGTGAQPELFQPSVPGHFTPADKIGGKNISINVSVGSVRSRQDLDYLAQEVARRVAMV